MVLDDLADSFLAQSEKCGNGRVKVHSLKEEQIIEQMS